MPRDMQARVSCDDDDSMEAGPTVATAPTRSCQACDRALEPSDWTQRFVTCGGCGLQTDLATRCGRADGLPVDDPLRNLHGCTLLDGELELQERIGSGSMGTIYSARRRDGSVVAVKLLSASLAAEPEFVARFRREADSQSRCEHPSIVRVHEIGSSGDLHFIVMDYVAGPGGVPMTVRDRLEAGRLSVLDSCAIVLECCAALGFAHDRGIIHRDVKPSNLLLDANGHVRLADFGVATSRETSAEGTLTLAHSIVGNLRYMAPEQKADPRSIDGRADLFALGLILYELLVGKVPDGLGEPPSRVRGDVPRALDAIVARAVRGDPAQRYQSAADFAADLRRFVDGRRLGVASRTRRATWTRSVALGVAVAAIAYGVSRPVEPSPTEAGSGSTSGAGAVTEVHVDAGIDGRRDRRRAGASDRIPDRPIVTGDPIGEDAATQRRGVASAGVNPREGERLDIPSQPAVPEAREKNGPSRTEDDVARDEPRGSMASATSESTAGAPRGRSLCVRSEGDAVDSGATNVLFGRLLDAGHPVSSGGRCDVEMTLSARASVESLGGGIEIAQVEASLQCVRGGRLVFSHQSPVMSSNLMDPRAAIREAATEAVDAVLSNGAIARCAGDR